MNNITRIIDSLKRESRFRSIPESFDSEYIDFTSNDYLGLQKEHQNYIVEFLRRFPDASFSSSASRLLSVNQKYHLALEDFLGELYSKKALLFNSGYHANTGCISALSKVNAFFVCDDLIHASMIDGLRIGKANFKRFLHNDIPQCIQILEEEYSKHEIIVVIVESIYSMDGDQTPLQNLVELKRKFPNLLLYVDEAHAFGVKGRKGLGLAEQLSLINEIDILILTFGKAAASSGAAVICNSELKNLFINLARSFIFSTALPPVNMAWTLLMIEKILDLNDKREYLSYISRYFKESLMNITGHIIPSRSQIVPLLTGSPERAISLASALRKNDILALPIRRPSVPPGGERIRFSLSASLSKQDIEKTIGIISKELDTFSSL